MKRIINREKIVLSEMWFSLWVELCCLFLSEKEGEHKQNEVSGEWLRTFKHPSLVFDFNMYGQCPLVAYEARTRQNGACELANIPKQ